MQSTPARVSAPYLADFFEPRAVVVVGASKRIGGGAMLRTIRERFGHYFLVHPREQEIDGVPCYPTVLDVPGEADLAIIMTPPAVVPKIIDHCGQRGIKYALIFSSGFAEVGEEGRRMQDAVGEAGRQAGVRIFGPNTNINAFEPMPPFDWVRGGKIGLITQSGHNGRPVVQGSEFGVAFSRWVPVGNEVDLEAADFIRYFVDEPATAVIAGYIEGFKDGDHLRRAADAAARAGKPIVLLKAGSTAAGSRMAQAHTGHLAGSDAIHDAIFRQHGITRVRDLDELLETSALFAKVGRLAGKQVCLYSISGGSGTLMAEHAELAGVPLAQFTPETKARLRSLLPDFLTVENPVDNGGPAAMTDAGIALLRAILADPNVDVLVCGITGALGAMTDKLAQDVVQVASEFDKPIIVTWNSLKTDAGFRQLIEAQLPIFRSFRNCFGALRAVFDYGEFLQRYEPLSVDADGIARLQPAPVPGTPTMLDEVASKALLAQYGIPAPREQLARAADEAVGIAGDLGYPVVVKVVSANIAHKSDAGLVRLGLADAAAVRVAVDEVLAAARQVPGANVAGVLVSEMVKDGHEVILGLARDPQFGMAVMFGLGGVFVEVLKDVTFRVPPFSRAEAQRMLREVKGFALLAGARGAPPADLDALVDGIMALERLSMERPDIEELDVNPLRVLPAGKGARALDALAVIRT